MSDIQIRDWPTRLMDLGTARCRTRRGLRNYHFIIPAGTVGRVSGTSAWNKLVFVADACPCCGVACTIAHLDRHDLELIESAQVPDQALPLTGITQAEAEARGPI